MNTHVVLVLDTRYIKTDGTAPIILRIIHHGASSQLKTGYYVNPKDWDEKHRKVRASYKGTESVVRLNNLLQKKKAEVLDAITKLDEQKRLDSMNVVELKNFIDTKNTSRSFVTYAKKVVNELNESGKIGNARLIEGAINVLQKFCKGRDIEFHELNHTLLTKFELHHIAKGNSANGIATYMKKIRSVYNRAIKEGYADKNMYPFEHFTIKTTRTRKRAIGMDAIRKIMNLSVSFGDPLFEAKNLFLLSFYMRGMSFADMAHMKLSNIVDGRIYYQRKKTDKPYNIKITEEIQELINSYIQGKSDDDFVFNIIKSSTPKEQYNDVKVARAKFNKGLAEIAKLCDIQEHLTSYVSRHSFATRAKNLGVPIATISDMLGHADTKTTEIYLDSLQSDLMDEAHEKIIR